MTMTMTASNSGSNHNNTTTANNPRSLQKSASMRILESTNRKSLTDQLQYRCRVLGAGAALSEETITSSLRLDFTSLPLYGRNDQKKTLLKSLRDAVLGSSQCVILYGPAGSGKTTLVMDTLASLQILFCAGKHERQNPPGKPYASIVSAFQKLLTTVEKQQKLRHSSTIASQIREALGNDANVLSNLLPSLQDIVVGAADDHHYHHHHHRRNSATSTSSASVTAGLAKHDSMWNASMNRLFGMHSRRSPSYLERFFQAFRLLLRAIASPEHPVAIFLDDLQWADQSTLRLLNYLLQDPESEHVLFVLSYETETPNVQDYDVARHLLEMETMIAPIYIGLKGLEFEVLNSMIAAVLDVEPDKSEALTAIVYNKTMGNCLEAQQYLGLLQDKGLLQYSLHSSEWLWDCDDIVAAFNNDQTILEARLDEMTAETQHILSRAAFLGYIFDFTLLVRLLIQDTEEGEHDYLSLDAPHIQRSFQDVLKRGILERTGRQNIFKFGHDRFHQLAYEQVGAGDERARIHMRFGYILSDSMKSVSITRQPRWMVFNMMDQFNLGVSPLKDPYEQERLAHINHQAARDAHVQSAFWSAAEYAAAGVRMLCGEDLSWPSDPSRHEMAMKLSLLQIEMCVRSHQVQECWDQVEVVLEYAKNNTERVRAYIFLIQVLSRNGRIEEALEQGLKCLQDHLGISFLPPKRWQVVPEVVKTKRMLRNYTQEDIMALHRASDNDKVGAVDVMTEIAFALFRSPLARLYVPILVCRIVQTTLEAGLSQSSPYCFAAFGTLLCVVGKVNEGYQYGALAMRLLDELEARHVASITTLVVHATVFHWKMHYKDSLTPLWTGYQMGIETGNLDHAFANAVSYILTGYASGSTLVELERKVEALTRKAREFKHSGVMDTLKHLHHLLLNLMGRPLQICGVLHGFFDSEQQTQRHHHRQRLEVDPRTNAMRRRVRLELAYFLSNCDDEEGLLAEVEGDNKEGDEGKSNVGYVREVFVSCLLYLRLAKDNPKFRKNVRKQLSLLSKYSQRGAISCQHMVLLVQAEQEHMSPSKRHNCAKGPAEVANNRRLHDRAIALAAKEGFLGDEALANELAGDLSLRQEDIGNAKRYFLRAFGLYQNWGAQAKVMQLLSHHGDLMGKSSQEKPLGVLRPSKRGSARNSVNFTTAAAAAAAAAAASSSSTPLNNNSTGSSKPIMPRAATKKIRFEPAQEFTQQRSILLEGRSDGAAST